MDHGMGAQAGSGGADGAVAQAAVAYLRASCPGLPGMFVVLAATAERPRVGSGAGSEHGGRLSGEILTTRLRMRLRMRLPGWIADVTEAMHRRDCSGGSHNYSNPGKVLEG